MLRPYYVVKNTLTARSQRLIREYRRIILKSISEYLDDVRRGAAKEIIPSKDPSNRWGFVRMYRNQPSTPGKLTERTGALIKMLTYMDKWGVPTARSISMQGNALQGHVKITTAGVTLSETYEGELKANIRDTSKYQPYMRGKRVGGITKQQLFFRFMWEVGIRGEKRPIMEPAARKIFYSTERLIQAKLDHLEMLGVIKYT